MTNGIERSAMRKIYLQSDGNVHCPHVDTDGLLFAEQQSLFRIKAEGPKTHSLIAGEQFSVSEHAAKTLSLPQHICQWAFKELHLTASFLESAQIQYFRLPAAAFQAAPQRYIGRVDDRLDCDDQ
jgi:hypothetical protein